MQHFSHLSEVELDQVFHVRPAAFGLADRDLFSTGLGATLYSPATRRDLDLDFCRAAKAGVVSAVACLEDSIPSTEVDAAERRLAAALRKATRSTAERPAIFVRVRDVSQIGRLVDDLGEDHAALSGFVLPKFLPDDQGRAGLAAVRSASVAVGRKLWTMPVLEAPTIAHRETRAEVLDQIRHLLSERRDDVLAVRVGATDLASVHALRRNRDLTIYDVRVVADAIADIVNVLGRADNTGFVITGPVWEHFATERLFKPLLRTTPFLDHGESDLRTVLLAKDLDALIREVVLDRANGLSGKTVIHPSHVAPVHALSIVTHEEWSDAADILRAVDGGALASDYGNKMNEALPHRAWAERTILRSRVFGVARRDVSFVEILGVVLRHR